MAIGTTPYTLNDNTPVRLIYARALTISKPFNASQATMYHARQFTSQGQNYWARGQEVHSEWQGKLASQWNLEGKVGADGFAQLSEGRHPYTGEQ